MRIIYSTSIEKPDVSVLITTYNQKKYIRECLDSIIQQDTYLVFEILIHDDASIDGTADIIIEYQKKYPHLITAVIQSENKYSKGEKVEDKYLFPLARGDYLAFCEGDDYWNDKHKINKQYELLKNNRFSMCVSKVQCLKENGEILKRTIPDDAWFEEGVINQEDLNYEIFALERYVFQTSSYFVRYDVYMERHNKPYFLYLNGDLSLLFTAMLLGDIYFLDDILSSYRTCAQSSWSSDKQKWSKEQTSIFICNKVKGVLYFNEETNYKYEKYIRKYIIRNLLSLPEDYREYVKNVFKKLRITSRDCFCEGNANLFLRYITMLFLPFFYKLLFNRR